MPMAQVLSRHTRNVRVTPIYPGEAKRTHVNLSLAAGSTIDAGSVLTLVGAATNDVQTISDTPTVTAGTFTISGVNPLSGESFTTAAIAYDAANSAVKSALEAALGLGITVTMGGGTLPGTDTTITFGGNAANRPVQLMTISSANLTGGSLAIAHTTTGRTAATYALFASGTLLAAPTTAPTLTATGADGTIGAGTYTITYTYVTAGGETTPSPGQQVTLTSAQRIDVTSITGLASTITKVRFYLDGIFAKEVTPSAGATGTVAILDVDTAAGTPAPGTNTAYTGAAPSFPKICEYTVTAQADGRVVVGDSAMLPYNGEGLYSVPAYMHGSFYCEDIPNLDARVVAATGRLVSGTVTSGVFFMTGPG